MGERSACVRIRDHVGLVDLQGGLCFVDDGSGPDLFAAAVICARGGTGELCREDLEVEVVLCVAEPARGEGDCNMGKHVG
jgi:hypothetical protein